MPYAGTPTDLEITAALRYIVSAVVGKAADRFDRTIDRDTLLAALSQLLHGKYPDLHALAEVMQDLPRDVDVAAVRRLLGSDRATSAVPDEDYLVGDESAWLRILDADLRSAPQSFPYVNDGHVELAADGQYRYVTSHLGRPVEKPQFSWPLLIDFRVAGRLEAGRAHATVVTDCKALGGVIYRHVAYVFFDDGNVPEIVVTAETNERETEAAVERGEKPLYYLGLFTWGERQNLGHVAGLDDLGRFLDAVDPLLGFPRDGGRVWLPADDRLVEMQAELINGPGRASLARLSAQLRLIEHVMRGADPKLLYDGCCNAVGLSLGLGDLDAALHASQWALMVDQWSAVTCLTDKEYEMIALVDPLRHGRLLFRLVADGRVDEAVELALESFRLCMTPRPRPVGYGFATHLVPIDDDFGDELLTVGMAGALARSSSVVEALRTASRRSELCSSTAGVAAAEALLGICLARQGDMESAMVSSARGVECALLLGDPGLVGTAVAAAAVTAGVGGALRASGSGGMAERRAALEESLLQAYGSISDRLVVSTLLAGIPLTEGAATPLFDAMIARSGFLGAGDPLPDSPNAWLEQLAHAAAAGRCRPIGRDDLADLMVSTPAGDFHWSDFVAVNRALMDVNSSMRLMTFASLDHIVDQAAAVLAVTPVTRQTDTGFILGDVGSVTATPLAPLLDFCQEYAISPALPQGEAGFVFENVIVLRRASMRLSGDDVATLAKKEWPEAWMHAFVHECAHVRGFMRSRRHSFLRAGWLRHVMSDILRLCDSGADQAAIAAALAPNFDNVFVWSDKMTIEDWQVFLDVDMHEFLRRWSLERILTMMTDAGLIAMVDGRLHSTIEGR